MSEILLKATALEKRYGGLRAVSGVSIDVHRDEVHAVIGPNGAGKSTLINMLSGDVSVTAGAIMLRDRDITTLRRKAGPWRVSGARTRRPRFSQARPSSRNVRLAAHQAHGGQAAAPLRRRIP